MSTVKSAQYGVNDQDSVLFPTHRTPRIVRFINRMRHEAPYPEYLPSLVHIDRLQQEFWNIRLHYHNYFEITYIAEGTGCFQINENIYELKKGELIITKPMEVHNALVRGIPYACTYSIGFNFDQLRELELPYFRLGENRVIADHDGSFSSCHREIMTELETNKNYAPTTVKAFFINLLVRILRNYEEHLGFGELEMQPIMSDTVKDAIQLIHTKGMNNLTSDEISTAVNRSRSHLDREFRKYMGVPLGEYIKKIRVDIAKFLLKSTTDSITDISEQLNFSSPQAFCMFFKRQTKLYPQEYRTKYDEKR